MFFVVPQMLTVTVGLVWLLGVTFMYPMMVSYRVTFRQLVKNSLMLAVGRLPQTVGVRLALLGPVAVLLLINLFTGSLLLYLLIVGYYFVHQRHLRPLHQFPHGGRAGEPGPGRGHGRR